MSKELSACLCGSKNVRLVEAGNVDARSWSASIECDSCEMTYSLQYCYATPEQAESTVISRWNARPSVSQEPVAEVIATGGPHDSEDRVLVELQADLPTIGTKLYAGVASSEPNVNEQRYLFLRENCYHAHVQVTQLDGSQPYVYSDELDKVIDLHLAEQKRNQNEEA